MVSITPSSRAESKSSRISATGAALAAELRDAHDLGSIVANVKRFAVLSLEGDESGRRLTAADCVLWWTTAADALPAGWGRRRRQFLELAAELAEEDGDHTSVPKRSETASSSETGVSGKDPDGRLGELLRWLFGV